MKKLFRGVMKKLILFAVLLPVICVFAQNKAADPDLVKRTEEWFKGNPNSMPHWMTPDELERINEIGKGFIETPPPVGPVRQTAEFERMQGVLIRYPFGIPVALIKQMSEVTNIVTIVATTTERNTVISTYISTGIDTSKCDFLIAPSDSYWTRDYGPWYVVSGDDEVGICDFVYNRPRPTDDDIPVQMAPFLDEPLYGMNLIHTGGNYMTDGMGIGASTDLVYVESGQTSAQVDQKMLDYLGITNYHVVPDPNTTTTIDHIDCWSKFLDVDKILIRSVPVSDPDYDELEASAAYFASQKSSYGSNYQVYRAYSPNGEPYTNSLILNDHVFVPIMNSVNDAPALAVYQAAMPGYTIVGVLNTTAPWLSTDALHCRTRGVVDKEMLYIYHMAKVFDQSPYKNIEISAKIVSYGGYAINDASLFYRINGGTWNDLPMTISNGYYKALIPPQAPGDQVSYYIRSEDSSGRIETHPFIGSADPHEFGIDYVPEISVSQTDTIRVTIPVNSSSGSNFTITNEGGLDLNYEVSYSYDGYAGVHLQAGTLHENDFSVFPGTGYTNSNWTAYNGGAQVTGNSVTGLLTSPQFQTDGFETLYLDFDQNFSFQTGSYSKVEYDNGSGWVQVYYQAAQSATTHQTISLPAGQTGILRFTGYTKRVSGGTASWFIDNIKVTGTNILYTPYTWMTLSPPLSGTLSPSDWTQLNFTCDSSGLSDGLYYADIIISSNDLNNPELKVTVELTVSQLLSAPSNLRVLSASSSQVALDWDPVAGASVYRIYRSSDPYSGFVFLNTSGTDSYTDTTVSAANKFFYYVTAGDTK